MKNKEHCFQSIITIPPYQDGIKVCKLSEKDIDAMYAICISNPYYFACMKSKPTKASLKEDLTALPMGKSMQDKYFLGFYHQEELLGFLDAIVGYPNEDCLYIGWVMIHKKYQGTMFAQTLMKTLLHQCFSAKYARLGCIKGNVVAEKFWTKLGFHFTKEEMDMGKYQVRMMETSLL